MENKLCVKGTRISLYFAENKDKRLVYDMSMEPEIADIMYGGKCQPNKWDDYKNKEDEFYTGKESKNSYLLIVYEDKIIGSVSHSYNKAEEENMELDIWFRSLEYAGKGLGVETLNILMKYLSLKYNINCFLIRPWIKNIRAINAYKKCGFKIKENFIPEKYYGHDVGEWGDGDYGKDETINMVKKIA